MYRSFQYAKMSSSRWNAAALDQNGRNLELETKLCMSAIPTSAPPSWLNRTWRGLHFRLGWAGLQDNRFLSNGCRANRQHQRIAAVCSFFPVDSPAEATHSRRSGVWTTSHTTAVQGD